jgi:hypothetical protein
MQGLAYHAPGLLIRPRCYSAGIDDEDIRHCPGTASGLFPLKQGKTRPPERIGKGLAFKLV